MNLDNAHLWDQLFGFIKILNIGMLVAYGLFPLIHMAVMFGMPYTWGEYGYLLSSFLAKAMLTITIFIACLQRDD